jgi:hypothetical protein
LAACKILQALEGSFVVVQEGANHVVYRLQEGSPTVSAQAGAKNRGF